jgi:hypothetical protein
MTAAKISQDSRLPIHLLTASMTRPLKQCLERVHYSLPSVRPARVGRLAILVFIAPTLGGKIKPVTLIRCGHYSSMSKRRQFAFSIANSRKFVFVGPIRIG